MPIQPLTDNLIFFGRECEQIRVFIYYTEFGNQSFAHMRKVEACFVEGTDRNSSFIKFSSSNPWVDGFEYSLQTYSAARII